MSPSGKHSRIELPPQEREYIRQGLARLGLSSLREYHRSVYWLCKHVAVKRRIPYRCRCGATRDLALHHKTYRNLGNERDEDLEFMCGPCHNRHHWKETAELRRQRQSAREKARQQPAVDRIRLLKAELKALYSPFTCLTPSAHLSARARRGSRIQPPHVEPKRVLSTPGLCPDCNGWGVMAGGGECPACHGKGVGLFAL